MEPQIRAAIEEMYLCNKPLVLICWLVAHRAEPDTRAAILDWHRNEASRAGHETTWMVSIT